MDITFHGAAREVTGSCHLVHVGDSTIALDFGMFQGRRAESAEKNRVVDFDASALSALVLSHAHIDHSGRLPLLARHGFDKPIYVTPATHDLCAIMLADSAHIQEKDAEFLARRKRPVAPPLYTMRDVSEIMGRMVCVGYDTPMDVAPGIRATFVDAGHILGSASVVLECTEGSTQRRLIFSADVGRWGLPIIRDPKPPEGADCVIMESTYGNRDHTSVAEMPSELARIVRETAARGGRVFIPAFAVGRTQELVYDLHRLARSGAIPAIPIVIDSPLAIDATSVFAMHPEIFDRSEELIAAVDDLFHFNLVEYTRDVAASKALNDRHGPMIVIAASGMAENGRILHHLAHGAPDQRNTILIVGFQAEHTLGRRIVEKQPTLRIFGDDVPLRAQVEVINGYSAHADRTELNTWIDKVKMGSPGLGPVWLVHGEANVQDEYQTALSSRGYSVTSPEPHTTVSF